MSDLPVSGLNAFCGRDKDVCGKESREVPRGTFAKSLKYKINEIEFSFISLANTGGSLKR